MILALEKHFAATEFCITETLETTVAGKPRSTQENRFAVVKKYLTNASSFAATTWHSRRTSSIVVTSQL